MAPCLSKLPSVCLESIFKHVPLSDLVYSVGLVCTSWYNSRRTELLRRRRLVLVADRQEECLDQYRVASTFYGTELIERVRRDDGSPWHTLESPEQFNFNLLMVPGGLHQTNRFFTSLITNFSNISQLLLVHYRCTNMILTDLIRLLDHLSEHLVELKLKIYFRQIVRNDTDELADIEANLFVCVNGLQSLRHLSLAFIGIVPFHPPVLTFLSRLATFEYYTWGNRLLDNLLIASLMQLAPESISIDFTDEIYGALFVQTISQVNNQLASQFNSLSVKYDNLLDYEDLRQFCTRFSSLTKLSLQSGANPMPMAMLARCLAMLPQLVQFKLSLSDIPPVEAAQPEHDDEEGEGVRAPIAQVPSVRLLILDISTNSQIEQLFIAEIFPNLQVLRVLNYFIDCQVCGVGFCFDDYDPIQDTEPQLVARIAQFKRLARQTFRRCVNLHTIELVHFNKKVLITPDEL